MGVTAELAHARALEQREQEEGADERRERRLRDDGAHPGAGLPADIAALRKDGGEDRHAEAEKVQAGAGGEHAEVEAGRGGVKVVGRRRHRREGRARAAPRHAQERRVVQDRQARGGDVEEERDGAEVDEGEHEHGHGEPQRCERRVVEGLGERVDALAHRAGAGGGGG